jgi:hypothetical protein
MFSRSAFSYELNHDRSLRTTFAIVFSLLSISYMKGYAQIPFSNFNLTNTSDTFLHEKENLDQQRSSITTGSLASNWFDVTYYRLALTIFPESSSL